jgi:hypothetical protein
MTHRKPQSRTLALIVSLTVFVAAPTALAQAESGMATAPKPLTAPNLASPLDAQAPVPALRYASTLSRLNGQPVTKPAAAPSWRASNEAVQKAGGWRRYAREAAEQPADAVAPAAAPTGHVHQPAATEPRR